MSDPKQSDAESPWRGFSIFITTVCEGTVPSVRDGRGLPCVFKTELEAQREIAENAITRLQEFIAGHREFADAVTVEEFVVLVTVNPEGTIVDEERRRFGVRAE